MQRNIFKPAALHFPLIIVLAFGFGACNNRQANKTDDGRTFFTGVTAVVETEEVPQTAGDDAADDPAIWINRASPAASLVFGTDKLGGLASYNLEGKELFYHPTGKMNNCDIRYDFPLGGDSVDILVASNRTSHSLSIYRISANGRLDSLHNRIITSEMDDEVYGICLYKSTETETFYVFLNSKAGEVEQWQLYETEGGIDARLVRSFDVGTQTEGMVADDEKGYLYLGHEVAGIWKFDAEPGGKIEGVVLKNSEEENPAIRYDIEGLAIYDSGNGDGYLIASSQGNNSFALFSRKGNNRYLGSFRIGDGKTDGVQDTDGLDVTSVPLGNNYPRGLLVVQDGINLDGDVKKSQNFKFVSWAEVEKAVMDEKKN